MPPQSKQKSAKVRKEVAERRKKILSSKEKILSVKRLLLAIIETMIEKDVSEDWFLVNCTKLCHADYSDVIQERSIENLCGYPLCSNTIKQTLKQKYHISRVTNKVYDLTERKCFCSNQCYKASNYLRAQLSPIPLYMRKEENIKVHLLSDCDNRGSAGEEVVFHHIIAHDEIEKVYNEVQISTNLSNILNEEVKKCADSLNDLQIKEHVFEKQYVFGDENPKKSEESDKNESNSGSDVDSDDSVDEKLFPCYENISVLSQKYMPIPEKIKKSVLISPLRPEKPKSSHTQELSLDFVFNVFQDWMTEDSMKFLLGEKYVYDVKADHLFKRMTTSEPVNSDKLSSIKEEYVKLCLKIDNLPDDDEDISDSAEIGISYESSTSPVSKKVDGHECTTKKVFKRRPKAKSKEKNKCVTFAPEVKASSDEKVKQYVGDNNINLADSEPSENNIPAAKDEAPGNSISLAKGESSKNNIPAAEDEVSGNSISLAKGECPKNNIPIAEGEVSENSISLDKGESSKKNVPAAKDEVSGNSISLDKGESSKNNVPAAKDEVSGNNISLAKSKVSEEPPAASSVHEPEFPLIDSLSQNVLRRKVFTSQLKSVYSELLPVAGLHYTQIREEIRKFVETLSLTPRNVIFKRKEWKLISLVLFRILTKTVVKDISCNIQLLKMCENPIIPTRVDISQLEKIVSDILCPENIINLK